MARTSFSRCTECEHCAEVVAGEDGVTIDEAGTLPRLTQPEWHESVNLIRSGKLPEPLSARRRSPRPSHADLSERPKGCGAAPLCNRRRSRGGQCRE